LERGFFKLSVSDCGRFLRLDNCTVAKDRFDYARVLLATSSLDVINFVEKVLIDGQLVELKIIEEWGYAIGEDACLLEEEDVDSKMYVPDNNFDNEVPKVSDQVADLVKNLANDWVGDDVELQVDSILKVPPESKEQVNKVVSESASVL
jgi:hypothetical protein